MIITHDDFKMVALFVKSALKNGWNKEDLRNTEKVKPKIEFNIENNFWNEAWLKNDVWQEALSYIFDNMNRITEQNLF